MITANNYLDKIQGINIKTLPEKLQKIAPDMPDYLDFYNKDEDITKTVNEFLTQLNAHLSANTEKKSTKPTPKRTKKGKSVRRPKKGKEIYSKTQKNRKAWRKSHNDKPAATAVEPKPKTATAPKVKKVLKPNWYKTIETFVRLANNPKPAWIVRKFLDDIQNRFDAKKDLNTPNIAKIRTIQNLLVAAINKNPAAKKLTLTVNQKHISEFKALLKGISIDKKAKPKVSAISLAGLKNGKRKRKTKRSNKSTYAKVVKTAKSKAAKVVRLLKKKVKKLA